MSGGEEPNGESAATACAGERRLSSCKPGSKANAKHGALYGKDFYWASNLICGGLDGVPGSLAAGFGGVSFRGFVYSRDPPGRSASGKIGRNVRRDT